MRARAVGLVLGYAADRALGDPRRFHPVAGFGRVASTLERLVYADSRPRGAAYSVLLVGGTALAAVVTERAVRDRPTAHAAATALATWSVLGGRSLEREAHAVAGHLGAGDLASARRRLTHLVGRDPSGLDAGEVARAVVESVAENTADAVVAPLLWGAFAGLPGLLGYRATNTLDAMVGHRTARHERFGWASARLDDLANVPAARLAGLLVLAARPRTAPAAWRTWRRDARGHPSPNAGVVEAAFAGSLGVRLGGTNVYGDRVEHRAFLGDGAAVVAADVTRSTRLARWVGAGAALVSALVSEALTAAWFSRRGKGDRPDAGGLLPR